MNEVSQRDPAKRLALTQQETLSREPYSSTFASFVRAIERPGANGQLAERDISVLAHGNLSVGVARAALERLRDLSLVVRFNHPDLAQHRMGNLFVYHLTPAGGEFAWSIGNVATSNNPLDVEWEPIPLERDETALHEATTAVTDLYEAVRADNGFAATHPEARRSILWCFEAGLRALRERVATSAVARELLLKPSQWVGKLFVEGTIGELAKKAAGALARLFGWAP